jgi:hypothetical protein
VEIMHEEMILVPLVIIEIESIDSIIRSIDLFLGIV